jgi:predicted metal-dependent phosphotriesterase family hydrolase
MFPESWLEQMSEWRYSRVVEWAIPALAERGVDDEQIRLMTRDNPRRLFETRGLGPY